MIGRLSGILSVWLYVGIQAQELELPRAEDPVCLQEPQREADFLEE